VIWSWPVNSVPDHRMLNPQFILTLCVFAVALTVIARMVILEKRPRDDLNPRLLPTTPILIASGFVALLALVHLINLAGVHTGRYN
jgi:hypothetical protein